MDSQRGDDPLIRPGWKEITAELEGQLPVGVRRFVRADTPPTPPPAPPPSRELLQALQDAIEALQRAGALLEQELHRQGRARLNARRRGAG
jgi:hypothetical protein